MSVFSALLNNGPLLVGPLADRGAFDQYASYRPGQVVVDDGVTYLNIAPVGAAPTLLDTFQRRDQSGWGQSDHGEAWQTPDYYASDGAALLRANRGLLVAGAGGAAADGQLLGASHAHVNADLLVRLALTLPAEDPMALALGLNAGEDHGNLDQVFLSVAADGTSTLALTVHAPPEDSETGSTDAGPAFVSGQDVWVRFRRLASVYSATVWAVGTVEPASPQTTYTASHAPSEGHPLVVMSDAAEGDTWSLGYLAVRPLTAATAPASDADHWVALADALQVPQPL